MRTNNNETKAEPAELPDDVDIELGADYQLPDPYAPRDASGELIDLKKSPYHYFNAANDGDNTRPDGIEVQKRKGYEVCTEEKILATDVVLMRISKRIFEARNRAQIAAANRVALSRGLSIPNLPEESTWRSSDHGRVAKVK